MSIPWRYLPPNLATFGSVIVSVAAIRTLQGGDADGAAWLILLCMLLDKLDGTLARALKAQSRFGVEMDSFADFLAFGLVPGLLLMSGQTAVLGLGAVPALLYIGCCLARLVRFNVVDADDEDRFRGLPSTAAGGLVAAFWLTAHQHGLPVGPVALGAVAVVLGLAMVSPHAMPKINRTGSRALDGMALALMVGVAVLIVLRALPAAILAAGLTFVGVGVVLGRRPRA